MIKNNNVNPEFEKALIGMTENPDFIDKFEEDSFLISEELSEQDRKHDRVKKSRPVSWIRNHDFNHRQWKRFLSHSPGESIECRGRHYYNNGIFICLSYYDEDNNTFHNFHKCYNLNLYNHLFISKRGDIRKLRGKIQIWKGCMAYVTGSSSEMKAIRTYTIRKVRNMPIDENNCNRWNYYRKQHIIDFD